MAGKEGSSYLSRENKVPMPSRAHCMCWLHFFPPWDRTSSGLSLSRVLLCSVAQGRGSGLESPRIARYCSHLPYVTVSNLNEMQRIDNSFLQVTLVLFQVFEPLSTDVGHFHHCGKCLGRKRVTRLERHLWEGRNEMAAGGEVKFTLQQGHK